MKLGTYKWAELNQPRVYGRYSRKTLLNRIVERVAAIVATVVWLLKLALIIGSIFAAGALWQYITHPSVIQASNSVTVVDKTPETVAMLTEKLVAIVHNGESQGKVMTAGAIFSVFDPSAAMKAQCQTPGTRSLDCESYGPYQEKIGTIQHYAPQVYGHSVTQMDAMAIANDNDKAKDFFVQCAVKVNGCVWNWTSASANRAQVQILIDTIRSLE